MNTQEIDTIVAAALQEDMPDGDVTSDNVIPPESVSEAVIKAKQHGILVGLPVARRVFEDLDPDVAFDALFSDGDTVGPGDKLAIVKGNTIALLKGERTALNFLQRLSGIATLTSRYVDVLKGTETRLLDTRKTTPGLRVLEKYAVKMGGGRKSRWEGAGTTASTCRTWSCSRITTSGWWGASQKPYAGPAAGSILPSRSRWRPRPWPRCRRQWRAGRT
jgi:nicotinate-nucleotide pyrophosphorylase (carboxylating)